MARRREYFGNRESRQKYIDKTEVLDDMCFIEYMPYINLSTSKQVADFYGIDYRAMRNIIDNYKAEFVEDGYKKVPTKSIVAEIKQLTPKGEHISIVSGKGGYILDDRYILGYAYTGLFTKKAILRVGMIIKNSAVALEVRTRLIGGMASNRHFYRTKKRNIISNRNINERDLFLAVVNSKTKEERAIALQKYREFKINQPD